MSSLSSLNSPDALPRQRRARTSKPKVKTGCNNCKQRRIKCDEKRPACSNCLRSKKICSGYPPPPRSARPYEEIRIAPRPGQDPAPQPIAAQALRPVQSSIQLPPRRATKLQRRNTPPETPVAEQSSVTLYRPSVFPFAQHQDGLYFQLFRTHTANELSGYFDSVFWSCLVLQECHAEASIRHAVVALGALYKTLEKHSESPPGSPNPVVDASDSAMGHWQVAVKSYSNACTALLNVSGSDSTANRTRLMASVLLACFDSFIGDHRQAIVQIQNGLKLLAELRAQRRRSFSPKTGEPVEEEIIQMFTRLAIQAKSYDMAFHFPKPYVIQLIQPSGDPLSPTSEESSPASLHQEPLPDQFSSLYEARLAWDAHCERIFRFTETLFSTANQNGPMGILPSSLRQFGLGFKSYIEAWSEAFEPILCSRAAPGVSSQEKAAIAVLKMTQIMGHVLFLMTFSDSEGHFDQFHAQFKAIVDLGREVVGDEERRAAEKRCPDPHTCRHHKAQEADIFGGHEYTASHIKPSFSADLGIVPPLYVVATKCRNPVIRRQAIQLLRSSSRREGMWDSELTARIGTWIMAIEEEDEPGMTPGRSPVGSISDASGSSPQPVFSYDTSPRPRSRQSSDSTDFGDRLGPGGNARWDARRESTVSLATRARQHVVPVDKRVMVRAVEFDLREHRARLQCGSRNPLPGVRDPRGRVTEIEW
ncbi:hypothetical protein N0V82_007865 [Gnomoniopsis sp. IMI 355080]|nr:hypothetical protein N0V82_007865 [Gnomoniopsis sp. IMI 355080]